MIYRRSGTNVSGPSAGVTPYTVGEIDCVVTSVLDRWYIYSEPHKLHRNERIRPDRPHSALDNWQTLELARTPEISHSEVA
jgi:hypothetical protein